MSGFEPKNQDCIECSDAVNLLQTNTELLLATCLQSADFTQTHNLFLNFYIVLQFRCWSHTYCMIMYRWLLRLKSQRVYFVQWSRIKYWSCTAMNLNLNEIEKNWFVAKMKAAILHLVSSVQKCFRNCNWKILRLKISRFQFNATQTGSIRSQNKQRNK